MGRTTILYLFILLSVSTSGQILKDAPDDKSIVYFMRPSSLGFLVSFTYFDGDKVIGSFSGLKYMRYICEPGEHIFWALSENRSYVRANLLAGEIYMVEAVPLFGGIKARVDLNPIDPATENLRRFRKLMLKKPPEPISKEQLERERIRLDKAHERGLERLEKLDEKANKIKVLKPEMFVEHHHLKPSDPSESAKWARKLARRKAKADAKAEKKRVKAQRKKVKKK